MTIFFAIMLGGYFLLLIAFKIGWRKIIRHPSPKGDQVNSITVLVPFRNEAKNLGRLCESLSRIRYSTENWQVIFINDHSTDNSVEIIESSIRNEPRFLLVHLDDRQEGKKNALTFGVNRAQGDIIVATDADCYLPENWLTIINTFFKEDNIRLAFGGVRLKADDSFFSRLQSIEFLSLIGSGGATLGLGFFSMCNGANLAFRKSAFEAVNGYDGNLKIASGDDEFLARKILLNFPGSVRFINVAEAVVETEAQATVTDFMNQRLRWAGKWKFNTSLLSKILAVFVLVVQSCFILLLFSFFFSWISFWFGLLLVFTKLFLEVYFLYPVSKFLKSKWNWLAFMALQFLYPLYVIGIGVASLGVTYDWKGRRLSHKM